MADARGTSRTWVYGLAVGVAVLFGYRLIRQGDRAGEGSNAPPKSNVYEAAKPETTAAPEGATPAQIEAAKQRLIAAMVVEKSCYRHSLDYAVRDPEFLSGVIELLLKRKTLAAVAVDEAVLGDLTRLAPIYYAEQLQTTQGLALLEKVIAARFAKPTVRTTGPLVEVDFGHIAGKLTAGSRFGILLSSDDQPHLVGAEWRSTEIAAAFQEYLAKYPDAESVQLHVEIPGTGAAADWVYTYGRSNDRVALTFPGLPTRPLMSDVVHHDFGPYLRGEKSLARSDLKEVNQAVWGPPGGSTPPGKR